MLAKKKGSREPEGAIASFAQGATTIVGAGAVLLVGGAVLSLVAALAALILIPLGLIPLAAVEPAPALYAVAISVLPAAASAATAAPEVAYSAGLMSAPQLTALSLLFAATTSTSGHHRSSSSNARHCASVRRSGATTRARRVTMMSEGETPPAAEDDDLMAIRAPLRSLGPYPVLSLRFPSMATPERFKEEQQKTGEVGVDTAANVNTINAKLAADLRLMEVGFDEGGVSAAGALAGGAIYTLGDCQLNDVPREERGPPFMSNLTASALPVASPSGAGLLGLGFLLAFPGGVELTWGGGAGARPSSLTLYGDLAGTEGLADSLSLCEVPCTQLADSGLLSVMMNVNGVEIPSLLDTGSPITVLNEAAAAAAGIDMPVGEEGSGLNPFAKAKAAVEMAAAVASGEAAVIGGVDGPVTLRKIPAKAPIALGDAALGSGRPYVGAIPGLAALDGLGADAGPAAVLGSDVLRQRERLVLRDGKVYV